MEYITKYDWNKIAKKEYRDDDVDDGICWNFYIEFNNQKYEINGYEKFPEEVTKIVNILKSILEEYLEEIVPNKKNIETIMRHKKGNILFMKFLNKKKIIDKKTLKDFMNQYKKYE